MHKIFLFLGIILSGCTFYIKDDLHLTIMKDGKPLPDYEITIKRANEAAMTSSRPENMTEAEMLWTLEVAKTDDKGHIHVPHHFITENRKLSNKPLFFISSKDINTCHIFPWYMEKEKFFIPMIFKNGHVAGSPRNLDDMTGDFQKKSEGMGWTVTATIHDMKNICEPEK